MGFFDIFRRNAKTPRLESGSTIPNKLQDGLEQYVVKVDTPPVMPKKQRKTDEEVKDFVFSPDTKTMAFSESNPLTGEIEIKLKRESLSGTMTELATLTQRCDKETLKYIVKAMDMYLDEPRTKSGLNPEAMEHFVEIAKQQLADLAEKHHLEPSSNLATVLDNINVKTQMLVFPEATLDYHAFEKQLPQIVDVSEMGYDQLMEYGEALTARLKELEGITSPESAYLHKDSLIKFMRYKEGESSQSKLLEMMPSMEGDISHDNQIRIDTIAECADAVQPAANEDSLLYDAYLKLEEKRITTQIQRDIKDFQLTVGTDTDQKVKDLEDSGLTDLQVESKSDLLIRKDKAAYEQAQELIDLFEEDKIKPVHEEAEPPKTLNKFQVQNEVVGYMIGLRMEDSVSQYVSNGLKRDIKAKSFLARHPEIAHSQEASNYLLAKMRSTGQVTKIDKPDSLREFIETTEYKSEVGTEIPSFLLSVAQMEISHIKSKYKSILHAFDKNMERLTQPRSAVLGTR